LIFLAIQIAAEVDKIVVGSGPYKQHVTSARMYRPTKSPASRRRLPHFGAISRSPDASLKSPASLALNLVS